MISRLASITRRRWGTEMIVACAVVLLAGCTGLSQAEKDSIRASVSAVLDAQVSAWNAGDIDEFMRTYWQSDELRFASGGTVKEGWEATLERYRTVYPDKAAMGQLTFDILDIQVVTREVAVVFGAWNLQRAQGDLSGLYTLLLHEINGRWLIVHDHTSRAR